MTVEEAAAFLRVNKKTLYEAIRIGKGPAVVRLGRSIRVSRESLVNWLRGNGGPALGEDR